MSDVSSRRSFVASLASIAGVVALGEPGEAAAQTAPPSAGPFDMAWLDQVKGAHKQLYDLGSFDLAADNRPLRFCKNFLDTFRDVFKQEHPLINSAVGISGPAFAMNASDRLWEKYKLGERSRIIDPATKQPSVRNIFLDGSDISVKAMQARKHDLLAMQRGAWQRRPAAGRSVQDAVGRRARGSRRRPQPRSEIDAVARDGACAGAGARIYVHETLSSMPPALPASRALPASPAHPAALALLAFPALHASPTA
jgi:hypothetical protein